MVDTVISFLLDNLTQLLTQESDLLLGVKDEVRSLCNELKLMNSFLISFEGRHDEQDLTKIELVNQLRDIAHEAEDVIDTYAANIAQQRGENFFGKFIHIFVEWRTRHAVGEKIKSITERIEKIHKDKEKFDIQIGQATESLMEDFSRRRPRLPIAEEGEVVGLDQESKTIINQLTNQEPGLHVVSIVGMGGLGKTTLARKIYNDPIVRNHFNFCAWVNVSKEYKVRELLLAIIKRFMVITDEIKEMDNDEIRTKLCEYLRSIKYLIVLDDVWETKCPNELNEIFVSNLHGSRIILTTRNREVALLYSNPNGTITDLRFLSEAESWELLSKKVFRGESCPPELKDIGRKIAEKCRGLPLAIVVLAGVLVRRERRDHWWPKILSKISSILIEDEETKDFRDILALSYNDLPRHLRLCFLYFGVFLEDFEIPTRQLIQLWIAEGFVKQKEGEPVEVTAEEYLEELIYRNLIQAAQLRFDRGVKVCRIHDLLRDLSILEAKKENFLGVHGNENPSSSSNPRRLAIHANAIKHISSNPSTSNVRSLLFLGLPDGNMPSSKHWKLFYNGFKLLRVMDLWGVVVDNIPSEIKNLVLLRYLRLRSHTARSLPLSIFNLWNLQTFELRAPLINRPHIIIWKMKQLRHLYFHGQAILPNPQNHDDSLSNIQTLSSISPDSCTKLIMSKIPNLVKLGIHGDLKAHMENQTFDGISGLDKLQTLKLERDRGCQRLNSLDWVEFPANITKLTLSETELSKDPMQKLGMLTKLQVLKLTNGAYVEDVLHCPSGGFPLLKVLKIINLGIIKWNIDTGSMEKLQIVVISRCSKLEGLPLALQNMISLRELELGWPNASVLSSLETIQKHIGNDKLKLTIINGPGGAL